MIQAIYAGCTNKNPGIVPPWLQKPGVPVDVPAPIIPLPGPDIPDPPCVDEDDLAASA